MKLSGRLDIRHLVIIDYVEEVEGERTPRSAFEHSSLLLYTKKTWAYPKCRELNSPCIYLQYHICSSGNLVTLSTKNTSSVCRFWGKCSDLLRVKYQAWGTETIHSLALISCHGYRSYGEKPAWYLAQVPSGLLPAINLDGKVCKN